MIFVEKVVGLMSTSQSFFILIFRIKNMSGVLRTSTDMGKKKVQKNEEDTLKRRIIPSGVLCVVSGHRTIVITVP
jgi:hypothetical protein